MVRKTLNLQELIALQKTINTMINNTTYDIIKNNAFLESSEEKEVLVSELYDTYNKLLDQLNIVKLAQSKANSKKSKLFGFSNQEVIHELFTQKQKKSLLETLFNKKLQNKKGGKLNTWKFHISKSRIEKDLDTVSDRITKIKESMTEFNTSHTVKIKVFEELNLL